MYLYYSDNMEFTEIQLKSYLQNLQNLPFCILVLKIFRRREPGNPMLWAQVCQNYQGHRSTLLRR